MCGPARNVCVCYGLWNPPTASLPNCISAPRVASWRKTPRISCHSSSCVPVPVGVVNLATCACVKSEEEGGEKTCLQYFEFGLQYLVQPLGVNPTYSTFKEDVRRVFLQGDLSVTVGTVKDESSLSCRLMWKTAHLQVLLVYMKVCFKISMKLTPVECHDGRDVKRQSEIVCDGERAGTDGRVWVKRQEWKKAVETHQICSERASEDVAGSTVINPLEQKKREKVEQNWHYEALYNMKEGRWHPQRKESRKTEPQFYFETVLCYGTLKQ